MWPQVHFLYTVERPEPELSYSIVKMMVFTGDRIYTNLETAALGITASWRVVVKNIGNTALMNVSVADPVLAGTPNFNLEPGEEKTFNYDTIPQFDMLNTVVAYSDMTESVNDSAEVVVLLPFTAVPGLNIIKTVDFNGDGIFNKEESGDSIDTAHWRIYVENTGDTYLDNVKLDDDFLNIDGMEFSLAPGESKFISYDTVVTTDTINTALVYHPDIGTLQSQAMVTIDEFAPFTKEFLLYTGSAGGIIAIIAGLLATLGLLLRWKGARVL